MNEVDVATDAELRDLARSTLVEMLRSPNEQIRARVATALVSYRASEPEKAASGDGWFPVLRDLVAELEEAELGLFEWTNENGRPGLSWQLLDLEQTYRNTLCTGEYGECFTVERRDGELWISFDSARAPHLDAGPDRVEQLVQPDADDPR